MTSQKTQLALELEAGMYILLGTKMLAQIYPEDIGAQQLSQETQKAFDELVEDAKTKLDEKDILHLFERLEALQ